MSEQRTKASTSKKKKRSHKKHKSTGFKVFAGFMKVLGTFLLSVILVLVITGSIFATALTIYILNYADTTTTVSLENITASYTSRFLYENPDYNDDSKKGDEYKLYYALKNTNQHAVWTDYQSIPLNLSNAVVAAEDERFLSHDGVDFKRTLRAFLGVFIGDTQGGSTITQQTIKNVTGDDARDLANGGAERKIREIFRAINVERTYSKEDILECYLNIISFATWDYDIKGVQAAANYYFGKDVSQLNLAECASIAAMIKEPARINPIEDRKTNKERAQYVLRKMNDIGMISTEEWDKALEDLDNLKTTGDITYSSVTKFEDETKDQGDTSWFMDDAINQAEEILMDYYGITAVEASEKLYSGGYTIYTTVDINMQKELEKKMRDKTNFQAYELEKDKLDSAFFCCDYYGQVKAVVGSRKKKKGSRTFSIATMGEISPGSTIKPIAAYGPAIDKGIVYYSTILKDAPIEIKISDTETKKWPVNYSDTKAENWTYNDFPLWTMLQNSTNTASAQLIEMLTPTYSYNFLQQKLDITTLTLDDADYAPLSIGATSNGLHLSELVEAYQIFGNGGKKYEMTWISLIEDKEGTVIYEHSDSYTQAIDPSSAYVMNRMMKKVVDSGTGQAAKLQNTELVGKTGTSEDWKDLLFVGCTPDYISGVWIGFSDDPHTIPTSEYQDSSRIWHNIFGDIAENEPHHTFEIPEGVVEAKYCKSSGLLATSSCKSTETGYYKESAMPEYCGLGY